MSVHARGQSRIQDAIAAHVGPDDLVVTNALAQASLGARHEKYVDLQSLSDLRSVLGHADRVWVIVLDRKRQRVLASRTIGTSMPAAGK